MARLCGPTLALWGPSDKWRVSTFCPLAASTGPQEAECGVSSTWLSAATLSGAVCPWSGRPGQLLQARPAQAEATELS